VPECDEAYLVTVFEINPVVAVLVPKLFAMVTHVMVSADMWSNYTSLMRNVIRPISETSHIRLWLSSPPHVPYT